MLLVLILLFVAFAHGVHLNGHDIVLSKSSKNELKHDIKNAIGGEDLWIVEGRLGEILDKKTSIFYGLEPHGRARAKMLPEYKYLSSRVNHTGCNDVMVRKKGTYEHMPCVNDVHALALEKDVYWMEVNENQKFYMNADEIPTGERVSVLLGNNELNGENEIIGIIDTGYDTNHRAFYHAEGTFETRDYRANPGSISTHRKIVVLLHNLIANFVEQSHGTAVASLAAGYNNDMGISGTAPAAKLVLMDVSLDGAALMISSSNILGIMEAMTEAGAEIINHSYGECRGNGEYSLFASRFDEHLWNNPYVLHVVAAGNYDPLRCPGTRKMGAPATAKNVISVGASFSTSSYYIPFVGNNNYDSKTVASFSSFGPHADGRRGPTVYGPSVWEDVARGLLGGVDHETYDIASGTSFGSPLVAGQVAVARQWFRQKFGRKPYGFTVKAILLARTTPMDRVVDAQTGLTQSQHPFGFGTSTLGDLHELQVVDGIEIQHGGRWGGILENFTQAAVAWYDRPATAYVSPTLINDVNLFVFDEQGQRLNSHDDKNAEEVVAITTPKRVRVVIIADFIEPTLKISFAAKASSLNQTVAICLPGETRECGSGMLQACGPMGWLPCHIRECPVGKGGFQCHKDTMKIWCRIENGEGELDEDRGCVVTKATELNHVIVGEASVACIYEGQKYYEDGSTSTNACNIQVGSNQQRVVRNQATITSVNIFSWFFMYILFSFVVR